MKNYYDKFMFASDFLLLAESITLDKHRWLALIGTWLGIYGLIYNYFLP